MTTVQSNGTVADRIADNVWKDERRRRRAIPDPITRSVFDLQRQVVKWANDILLHSDVAYRNDRYLQRQMRNDPQIMSPLLQRQYAVAQLPWKIVAENEEDETQVEQAKVINRLLDRHLRAPTEFLRVLLEAVWGGRSGINLHYEIVDDGLMAPTNWTPLHWDSIAFNDKGDVALYVNSNFPGETVQAQSGYVTMLSTEQRESTVVHVFNRTPVDFDDPYEAEFIYGGRGLRDVVWYFWLILNVQVKLWATYNERYGMGIRVGYYPAGNVEAEAAMKTVLDNLIGDVSVTVPYDPEHPQATGLDIKEPNAGQQSVFAQMIDDYLAGLIKELIIGQRATTEEVSSGLGSSVGDKHAETFKRIIKADAAGLEDTLTTDLVEVMHRWNFGDTPYRPRWVFLIEDEDSKSWMEGAERAYQMGLPIPKRQVYDRLGIDEPKPGEECLEFGAHPMSPIYGDGTSPWSGNADAADAATAANNDVDEVTENDLA